MNRPNPHGPNRDAGARLYQDMPSVTDRGWAGSDRGDDSFGPPGIGGPDEARSDVRGEEDLALRRSTQRAMHARRGTKNATRSDTLIAEELNERLRDDELVDASEILVSVDDGRVVLSGDVPDRWMKHRAEDIADAIRGVASVDNRIRVDNGAASFGAGGAVRSGLNQPGSGFSSSPPNADWQAPDNRVD